MAYDYETLLVEKRGHVAWLYFNRPDALNAFNVQMTDDLNDAWKELDADDDVRVIVNTGKGRAFQTGVDVKEVSEAGGMAGRGAGRERKEGGFTALTIELWDAGPSGDNTRWRVHVKNDDTGREAAGNPDERLDQALANVHWDALGD